MTMSIAARTASFLNLDRIYKFNIRTFRNIEKRWRASEQDISEILTSFSLANLERQNDFILQANRIVPPSPNYARAMRLNAQQ